MAFFGQLRGDLRMVFVYRLSPTGDSLKHYSRHRQPDGQATYPRHSFG